MKPCPAHVETRARCDYCQLSAEPRRTFKGVDYPEGWTLNGSAPSLWACPGCTIKLRISADAICSMDAAAFKNTARRATLNLIDALRHVDTDLIDALTPFDAADLEIALQEATGRAHRLLQARILKSKGVGHGVVMEIHEAGATKQQRQDQALGGVLAAIREPDTIPSDDHEGFDRDRDAALERD